MKSSFVGFYLCALRILLHHSQLLYFLLQTGFDIVLRIADQMQLERIHQILHHIRLKNAGKIGPR